MAGAIGTTSVRSAMPLQYRSTNAVSYRGKIHLAGTGPKVLVSSYASDIAIGNWSGQRRLAGLYISCHSDSPIHVAVSTGSVAYWIGREAVRSCLTDRKSPQS
jgi:hypothetical protein